MAVIWQRTRAGKKYEVRAAGSTRRLYTDGVCHSEYHPGKVVTGSVWDLLTLPVFFYDPDRIRRVLVLGVGGGAVIRQLLTLLPRVQVVGVENDPVHLYIGRRFYQLEHERLELHQADAAAWLRSYRGPVFDVIIEDLFVEHKRQPVRAVAADPGWLDHLLRHLWVQGALVINFPSAAELQAAAAPELQPGRHRFHSMFRLRTPALDNAVGAFLRTPADSGRLRARLRREPLLAKALANRKLRYRIQRLEGPARVPAPTA